MSDGHGDTHPLPFFVELRDFLHSAHDQGGYHVSGPGVIIAFAVVFVVFFLIAPRQSLANLSLTFFLAPLWMPYILVHFASARFVESNRLQNIAKRKMVLLEIKMPRETRKSPLSMETVFASMYLTPGEGNWYAKHFRGGVRPWWSFEIVSLGGRVHFYLWTPEGMRRGLESYFYAQYPNIEIVEAVDYSLVTDPGHAPNSVWGCDFLKKKPSPYPIKTYIDFGLDRNPKPEEQTDPLAQVLEYLGSLGPQEQIWMQFVIRGTKDDWKTEAKGLIEEIRAATVRKNKHKDPVTGQTVETDGFPSPTKGQSDLMNAIERNVGKSGFDTGIRFLYTAPKDAFNGSSISHLVGLLNPFNNDSSNGFRPTRWFANFSDYPWEDPKGIHKAHVAHGLVDAYRRRSFFYEPYRLSYSILSTEELASIWHITTSAITTPSLPRIQSSTSEAPSNLPT